MPLILTNRGDEPREIDDSVVEYRDAYSHYSLFIFEMKDLGLVFPKGKEERTGIYVLIGDEGECYVGQTKRGQRRFLEHLQNKDWVRTILFFTPSEVGTKLDAESLLWLENKVIEWLHSSGVKLKNGNDGSSSEYDWAALEKHFSNFQHLWELCRVNAMLRKADVDDKAPAAGAPVAVDADVDDMPTKAVRGPKTVLVQDEVSGPIRKRTAVDAVMTYLKAILKDGSSRAVITKAVEDGLLTSFLYEAGSVEDNSLSSKGYSVALDSQFSFNKHGSVQRFKTQTERLSSILGRPIVFDDLSNNKQPQPVVSSFSGHPVLVNTPTTPTPPLTDQPFCLADDHGIEVHGKNRPTVQKDYLLAVIAQQPSASITLEALADDPNNTFVVRKSGVKEYDRGVTSHQEIIDGVYVKSNLNEQGHINTIRFLGQSLGRNLTRVELSKPDAHA